MNEEAAKTKEYIVSAKTGVNIRNSPNLESDILLIAEKGTILQGRGSNGEWTRVCLPGQKQLGYVMSRYLTVR